MSQDLTPQEKAQPYSKYFFREPAAPDPDLAAFLQDPKPMDPSKALPIERLNDLLNPGYHEVETGWCVLPNGAGYVAVNHKMPGVTVDMINWWMAWHALEDLRYKIWWPKGHFGISVSDAHRERILDPNRPVLEKIYGVSHHVVEDVGIGPEDIYINFVSPEEAGFDMTRFKAPNVATLFAANGIDKPRGTPPDEPGAPAFMCHFIREIPGGIEYRTRFWMGYQVYAGKPELILPPGVRVPEAAPRGLFMHNIVEYANLRAILPSIYKEQEGRITAPSGYEAKAASTTVPGVNTIKIDEATCNGCKTCYRACFVDVFRFDEVRKKPIVAYPEDCVNCNVCELNCPKKCIEVIVDWNKHYPPTV